MSFFKNSLFWVLALVLAAGAFYLLDRRAEEKKATTESAKILLPFSRESVIKFEIISENDTRRVEKEEGKWMVIAPLRAKGDEEVIGKLFDTLFDSKKDAVLFEKPDESKLLELGLSPPAVVVRLITADGETEMLFGDKGPTHNVSYAMLSGDKRVFRIHSDIAVEANKPLYELRDKTIVDFEPLEVKSLDIERRSSDRVVVEQPRKTAWDMTSPVKGKANLEKVLETLYKLKNSEIKSFIDPDEGTPLDTIDKKAYGLDDPLIRVTVNLGPDMGTIFEIGAKDRVERGYFARTNVTGGVFVVEEELVEYLSQKSSYWMEKEGL